MQALKAPGFGVVSEGDVRAAASRMNELSALHALRDKMQATYGLPGRFAAPLNVKDRANMVAEVVHIAQAQNANLAHTMSCNKHLTHSDV